MENCFDLPPIILYLSEFKNAADIQDQDIRWNVNVFWWFAISPLNNYLMSYPFDISVRISSWNKNKQILIEWNLGKKHGKSGFLWNVLYATHSFKR